MSDEYARLLAAWKEADTAARSAQDALDARLERFIHEDGPVPSEAEREQCQTLPSGCPR